MHHPAGESPKAGQQPSKSGRLGQIIVLKVGTSSLVNPELQRLNLSNLARIIETVKALHTMGHHVIIVTSGAVGVGCQRLGLSTKPVGIAKKQALAAVGQVHLMKFYEDFLNAVGLTCAQVLVTLDNLSDRGQYINVRNTFTELMAYGVIPVVNENDTVAAGVEYRFGDNDTLSAQVAALVQANYLFLMTDVDYLYTSNPKNDPDAQPIYEVHDMFKLVADTSTNGTQWGTGGMATKLTAGRLATAAGTTMVICNSMHPELIEKVLMGVPNIGTKFHPIQNACKGRKRWILSVPVRGQVWVDSGAFKAVKDNHTSLLFPGIIKVEGDFNPQDAVQLCDDTGMEFARGLTNFNSDDMRKIVAGKLWKKNLAESLGYGTMEEVLHRDNITLLARSEDEEDTTSCCISPACKPAIVHAALGMPKALLLHEQLTQLSVLDCSACSSPPSDTPPSETPASETSRSESLVVEPAA